MKKYVKAVITMAAFALITSATSFAGLGGTSLKVTIPFSFEISGKTLPAGTYSVSQSSSSAMSIRNGSSRISEVFQVTGTSRSNSDGKTRLRFARYGNIYFLTAVMTGDEYNQLPQSSTERDIVKRLESKGGSRRKSETVNIEAQLSR